MRNVANCAARGLLLFVTWLAADCLLEGLVLAADCLVLAAYCLVLVVYCLD